MEVSNIGSWFPLNKLKFHGKTVTHTRLWHSHVKEERLPCTSFSTPVAGIIYVHVILNWQQKLNKKIWYKVENTHLCFSQTDSVSGGCALMCVCVWLCACVLLDTLATYCTLMTSLYRRKDDFRSLTSISNDRGVDVITTQLEPEISHLRSAIWGCCPDDKNTFTPLKAHRRNWTAPSCRNERWSSGGIVCAVQAKMAWWWSKGLMSKSKKKKSRENIKGQIHASFKCPPSTSCAKSSSVCLFFTCPQSKHTSMCENLISPFSVFFCLLH